MGGHGALTMAFTFPKNYRSVSAFSPITNPTKSDWGIKQLQTKSSLSWEDVMPQLYEIGEKLRWSWGVVSHLNAVCNSTELRAVHSNQQPTIVRFSNQLAQNDFIFKALSNLKEHGNIKDETQIRIIETELITMKNKGIGLRSDEKALFNLSLIHI